MPPFMWRKTRWCTSPQAALLPCVLAPSPPLSGVGLLRSKRHLMTHSWFCFSLLGTGPRFGYEAADGQALVVEERHEDSEPALAKDADQPQPCGLALAWERQEVGGQQRQRADRDSILGCPAHAEQPQGGHGHRQPQPRGPLRLAHARAVPRPPRSVGDLEAWFDP